MPLPGEKYFKGRVYNGSEVHHYVVWDGIHDYQNMPPVAGVMMMEFPPGRGDIHIVQIGKPGAGVQPTLNALMALGPDVHMILWARDHRTYRAIVKELEGAGPRLQ